MEKRLLIALLFSFMTSTLCFAQDAPITEVEGEPTTYTREGKAYYPKKYGDDNYIYEGNQGGSMTIVFGADRQVYLQDPVYGYTHGTYVKGTLSEDGKTITVVLPQVLYDNSGIDVILAVGKFDEDQKIFKRDETITEVIYDIIENEESQTLSLRLTDKMTPLGNFWSDNDEFAGRGEWSTVLTKYIEKTETTEVSQEEKEQLVTEDHPLGGAFWQDGTCKFLDDAKIWVATKEGSDTILVQGLVPMLPEVWAKGLKKDGVVTFPVQLLTVKNDQKYFLAGLSGDGQNLAPFTLDYDENLGSYTAESKLIINNSDLNYNNSTILGEYTGIYVGERPALVQLPEGYDPANIMEMPYEATYNNGQGKTETAGVVNVLFHGEDIYIQGLIKNTPEGWLKGQFNQTQEDVFFPLGQYMGYDAFGNVYAVGDQLDQKDLNPLAVVDDPAAIRLSYDSDNQSFRLMNNLYASHQAYEINRDDIIYAGMTINEGDMWVAAKQGYENATDVTAINLGTTNFLFDKATNNNNPKYYNSGQAVRMYAGNTLTISSTDKAIGTIAFVFDTSKPAKLDANEGVFTITDSIGIWTGDANSVVFNVPNESGNQARIKRLMVFYFDYSTTTVMLPENDVVVMTYQLKATIEGDGLFTSDEEIDKTIKVIKQENEFYFQGLSKDIPEAWVKGTLSDNKIIVPNWLLGTYLAWGMFEYNQVFGGAEFIYDQETGTITAESYKTLVPSQGEMLDTEYKNITMTMIDNGIMSMSSGNENVFYYDLQGHMVQPSAKGLLIQKTLKNDGTTTTKKVIFR